MTIGNKKLKEAAHRRGRRVVIFLVISFTFKVRFAVFRTSLHYICMYGHTYIKSMDQPGMVANPARGQLNKKKSYFTVRVRA